MTLLLLGAASAASAATRPAMTNLDKFRLELGDTPAGHGITPTSPATTLSAAQQAAFAAVALFNDGEITYFLTAHPGSVLLAVAAGCDALAARFAWDVDVTEDRQSFSASQAAKQYEAMAARFRARAALESVDVLTGAGLPTGRVPVRCGTTWSERW